MEPMEFVNLLNATHSKFDSLDAQIRQLTKSAACARDLKCLRQTSLKLRDSLSKELVECRRINRVTATSQRLLFMYSTSVTALEEYVTFGILVNS